MTGHALTRRAWSRSRRGLAGRTILRVLVELPLCLAYVVADQCADLRELRLGDAAR
jgi:hypothetical protein